MPIGVIINALSIFLGEITGTLIKDKLSSKFKQEITLIFGACSMAMGISSIILMKNMPAVIFAIVIGTAIGLAIHLGDKINELAALMRLLTANIFPIKNDDITEEEYMNQLVTIIVLFCASGTGIYGTLTAGMIGDNSILISKSILDFFTAAIFACNLRAVVSTVAIPQFIIFFVLFIGAGFIFPLTNADMILDFKACDGILMLATGFRMIKVKNFPIADMIPAMILVMSFSYIWATFIISLL